MKKLLLFPLLMLMVFAQAQVKIGNNPDSINSNSILEMESTNKGFLPPRVALNSLSDAAPLSGTVPAGIMVYSTGGLLSDGYYYWDGIGWKLVGTATLNTTIKTASDTLTKTETFVLASNDITLTLPVVTAADDGLSITIKNIGTHTDQTTIIGSAGATLDGIAASELYRWLGRTFIAYNGNWLRKDNEAKTNGVFDVTTTGSWTTITEVLEFLNLHMAGPSVIRLSGETYTISATEVIDLPYSLTIQGASYGATAIEAGAGLANAPMFRCLTEAYFKQLTFDATTLAGYGNNSNEDAIQLEGAGEYYEIKDCFIDGFNKGIVAESNVELWLFETEIAGAVVAGLEIAAGLTTDAKVSVSECDFTGCTIGINLKSGVNSTINIINSTFYNALAGDVGINYIPANFSAFTAMFITNNAWNNTGSFFSGFDFARSDSRDAKAHIDNNAGVGDSKAQCFINVVNSTTGTYLATLNTWYKVNWGTNTSMQTTKWTINNNKITYQPNNRRNGWIIISGTVSADANSQNITIGIVKNGLTGTQYGATTIRTTTGSQPFPFTIIVNLLDIALNDYFELFVKNETSSLKTVKFQDIQWLVNTQ